MSKYRKNKQKGLNPSIFKVYYIILVHKFSDFYVSRLLLPVDTANTVTGSIECWNSINKILRNICVLEYFGMLMLGMSH